MWKFADSPLRGDRWCSRVISVMLSPSPRSTNQSGIGVDRQVLSGAILSHRIQDPSVEELVASRHMGHDVADRPGLAESGVLPAFGWNGVDCIEIPACRLSELAGLCVHRRLPYPCAALALPAHDLSKRNLPRNEGPSSVVLQRSKKVTSSD